MLRCIWSNEQERVLTISRTCTSSIYTSTYEQLEKEFHCSRIVATLGLSLFIMGLGIGPMLLGPGKIVSSMEDDQYTSSHSVSS